MLVADYKIKSILSARYRDFKTYELEINGLSISKNLPCFEPEDGFVQIDVCDECFTIGCASGGYVQVILANDIVIWKEPLIQKGDSYIVEHYYRAYGLKYGTIFWPIEIYMKFLDCYDVDIKSDDLFTYNYININQAKDLWRIYGSKCYEPNALDSISIERLEEQFLTMYSEEKSDKECWDIYKSLSDKWENAKSTALVRLSEDVKHVYVIFDVIQGYSEWNFICYDREKLYFPIGDNFAMEINQV